jgi:aldehyde dehydrogenase (NAD+)
MAPHTANLIAEWIPKVLDPSAVKVVLGAVSETTALLKEKFDYIFYTGKFRFFFLN